MGRIDNAFVAVPRQNFLPPDEQAHAELDIPLPIGFEQTNSQPTTVRMMLEWLDVQPGQRILDVGSGSGWTSGLLAHLVGKKGRVIAVEKVPALVKFGEENCRRLGIKNAEFHEAENTFGWQDEAPYDRILVSAAADDLPQELLTQLANNGKMVIPVRSTMLIIQKNDQGEINQEAQYGLSFVPLV